MNDIFEKIKKNTSIIYNGETFYHITVNTLKKYAVYANSKLYIKL